ncbi:MAG: polysaccharide deacetylase family protein [Clostridia bacterium]|nr:polysaccharide deacetylase family protein [Clostridia bacterium]
MKRIKFAIPCVLLIIAMLISAAPSEGNAENFYIKRNGSSRPVGDEMHKRIESLGAYYIDKSSGDTDESKRIYLTFDVGYENGNVAKILDVMKEKGVVGAFFILKYPILKNPDLILRMVNEGHLVCNHTKNHKDMTKLTNDEITKDLSELEEAYFNLTGREISKYFRFPEGRFSQTAIKHINSLGYKSVFWSFAYADWDNNNQQNPALAFDLIINNTHSGEVILLHPTSSTNAEILGGLIDKWREMGYTFGTLDELCKEK